MAGHVIAVVGGKGGVGKSVFAANLAIAYLQEFKQRPLILDLDLSSLGDQVKRVEDLNSLENLDRRVEEDKDKGFSSRSFLSGKFCCQSVN